MLLLNNDMHLRGAAAAELANGANLAVVGEEVLQFTRAEYIAPRTFRLSGLWRGRGGTEYAVAGHGADEDFVLLDNALLPVLETGAQTVPPAFAAIGRGDADAVIAEAPSDIRAFEPFSPVHMRADWSGADNLQISWVRRSRSGTAWRDHVDVPLGEESECYSVVMMSDADQILLRADVDAPRIAIDPAMIQSARMQGVADVQVTVRQKGQFTVSRPTYLSVPL